MNILKPVRLAHLKTQAAFLLKDLRSGTPTTKEVAERFLKLPTFSSKTFQWIADNPNAVKLKDALLLTALDRGFKSWADLKQYVTLNDCLYRPAHVGLLYAWFKTYEQAAAFHQQHGGYLLSFWKDFVVCGDEYIYHLSLLHYSTQWEKIGYDWVKPTDTQAWEFLNRMAANNYSNQK